MVSAFLAGEPLPVNNSETVELVEDASVTSSDTGDYEHRLQPVSIDTH